MINDPNAYPLVNEVKMKSQLRSIQKYEEAIFEGKSVPVPAAVHQFLQWRFQEYHTFEIPDPLEDDE